MRYSTSDAALVLACIIAGLLGGLVAAYSTNWNWNALAAIGQIAGAAATTAAVIIALDSARRDRARLQHEYMLRQDEKEAHQRQRLEGVALTVEAFPWQLAKDATSSNGTINLSFTINNDSPARLSRLCLTVWAYAESQKPLFITPIRNVLGAGAEWQEAYNEVAVDFPVTSQSVKGLSESLDASVVFTDPEGMKWKLDRYGTLTSNELFRIRHLPPGYAR